MKLTAGRIDDRVVHVLSDPRDEEMVVRLPRKQWRELLLAACHFYEAQSGSVVDVMTRLMPSPSSAEMAEVQESYNRDAEAVSRLLG